MGSISDHSSQVAFFARSASSSCCFFSARAFSRFLRSASSSDLLYAFCSAVCGTRMPRAPAISRRATTSVFSGRRAGPLSDEAGSGRDQSADRAGDDGLPPLLGAGRYACLLAAAGCVVSGAGAGVGAGDVAFFGAGAGAGVSSSDDTSSSSHESATSVFFAALDFPGAAFAELVEPAAASPVSMFSFATGDTKSAAPSPLAMSKVVI